MNQCQVGNYQSSLKSNLGEPSDRNFELGYLLFWAILLSFELMEGAQQGAGDLRAREDTHLTALGPAGTVHGRQIDGRWTTDGRHRWWGLHGATRQDVTNICDSDATEQILWTDLCEGNFWCGPGSIRYFLCFFLILWSHLIQSYSCSNI